MPDTANNGSKTMPLTREQILNDVKERHGHRVLTAGDIHRSYGECVGPECELLHDTEVHEASGTLVYPGCRVDTKSIKEPAKGDFAMTADVIVTTSQEDADKDILEPSGAEVRDRAAFLWQHIPLLPLGKVIEVVEQTEEFLRAKIGIAKFGKTKQVHGFSLRELADDAMTLIGIDALGISHGFDPYPEHTEKRKGGGFHFKRYKIFEVSGVSVPANEGAQFEAFERMKSPLVKSLFKPVRKASAPGVDFEDEDTDLQSGHNGRSDKTACTCHLPKAMDPEEQVTLLCEIRDMLKQRGTARTPSFSGTEDAQWSKPTLSDYISGWNSRHDSMIESGTSVDDLTSAQKTWIANHTLLGDGSADTFDELSFFPVVNPSNGSLNANALRAVLGGRGAQADISESALDSARSVAERLLENNFGEDKSMPVETKDTEGVEHEYTDDVSARRKKDFIPGSWEWTEMKLGEKLGNHLSEHGVQIGEDDFAFVMATFSDHAIARVIRENDEPKDVQLQWRMEGDEPAFVGEPIEVEIEESVTIRPKDKAEGTDSNDDDSSENDGAQGGGNISTTLELPEFLEEMLV